MRNTKSKTTLFVSLFLLGNAVFSYPVLTLFNYPLTFLGIPVFFFYLFSAWFCLIGLVIVCTETESDTIKPDTKQ